MVANSFTIHFAITTSMLFLAIPFSNGIDAVYTVCSSQYSCGLIKNISYPFWGGDRSQLCGRPEFQLICLSNSDYPLISINTTGGHSEKARVLSINTSTHKMVIALDRFLRSNATCPIKKNSTILNLSTMYKFSPRVANLGLFYGCPNSVSKDHDASFVCSYFNGTNVPVFYETSEGLRRDIESCKANYTAPVFKSGLDELNHGNGTLLSVLRKGFELEYIVNFTACTTCENSGGRCGSSDAGSSKFVCHCRNGPQSSICHKSEKKSKGLKIGLGISVGIILLIAVLIAIWHRKKLNFAHSRFVSRSTSLERTSSDLERGNIYFGVPLFSYRELEEATDNFDQSRELGDGGFGTVYYGKLKDGREVAVKRLFEKSYKRVEQFINEVQILTCLRHQNLVSLYGCTSHQCRELLLVYEYVPNGTVADHLYGDKAKSGSLLPWPVRMRIALETASALSYLHATDIIHRDVKTNNILLDSSFSVKVADFGLSRLFPNDVTHVSTAPQGTPGYVDPEYHQCYQLTNKSDVFSFGVVLIELISSLPAVDMHRHRQEINLSTYAMNKIQRCAFEELVDPQLGFVSDFKVRRMTTSVAELAFQCLQHDKEFRPSMDEALEVLKRIESADYEAMKAVEASKKSDGVARGSKPPRSPLENDDAKLLPNRQPNHPSSPNSVMDKWGSRNTTPSSSK